MEAKTKYWDNLYFVNIGLDVQNIAVTYTHTHTCDMIIQMIMIIYNK